LYESQTGHQNLIIFDNATFGRVMLLDGVVQLTTKDEFIYHEMMAHVPLFALGGGHARRVLVIGGGDGGVMREVLKHKSVERVVLCELDDTVVRLSREHLPQISNGAFDDPRAEVVIADGVNFVAGTSERFDAIIVDSTEPVGPAAVLFTPEFFRGCARCLNSPGVLVTQNGLPFMHPEHLRGTMGLFKEIFADGATYLCDQPTYFGGPFALAWASNDPDVRQVPLQVLEQRFAEAQIETGYYTPELHKASFVLPRYIQRLEG
jgi:spermidine synthase